MAEPAHLAFVRSIDTVDQSYLVDASARRCLEVEITSEAFNDLHARTGPFYALLGVLALGIPQTSLRADELFRVPKICLRAWVVFLLCTLVGLVGKQVGW